MRAQNRLVRELCKKGFQGPSGQQAEPWQQKGENRPELYEQECSQ